MIPAEAHDRRRAAAEQWTEADRHLHAAVAKMTLGLSPISLMLAGCDWWLNMACSPGKWVSLAAKAAEKQQRLLTWAMSSNPCQPCIAPLAQDRRFDAPGWRTQPFCLIYQSFLMLQQWWHNATTGVGGVSPHHEQVVNFMARQCLDVASPSNFVPTNPELIGATLREGGLNLWRGSAKFARDLAREMAGDGRQRHELELGRDLARTPGKVVFRNRLIELIQYSPCTRDVYATPVLVIPAWIMKYYILDLSPHNSLVAYLVGRGHTVFMVSWHNPTKADRDLGLDDYLELGAFAALRAVQDLTGKVPIDAVGYCLGGTLLSMAAAALGREAAPVLNSVSLFATQADFREPGELMLFVDENQLDFLDDVMWQQGYLDNRQMAGAFKLLRSHDLIWSRIVNDYLLGKESRYSDLMAWNADATRMPYRMHSEYLRKLLLNNELFEGRFRFRGRILLLSDIQVPVFSVATETDHIAPWRSVFRFNTLRHLDRSFVLTSGGHNAGIVSEPGHPGRRYRIGHWAAGVHAPHAQTWFRQAPPAGGSWWPAWQAWLAARAGARVPARQPGPGALGDAPGSYVHEH
jgi:polyhydroxyalkanoate synthase